jgi:formate dehydrogenase (coenzyme F420) beta subunit
MDYTKNIQDIATRLFAEDKTDIFIAYKLDKQGRQVPEIIGSANKVSNLVFDDHSSYNLCNYLKFEHTRNKRVGIVVKGCDSRALNLMITEKQIAREKLYIIGIACEGIQDEKGNKEARCNDCIVSDAVIYDELLGTPAERKKYTLNAEVQALSGKSLTERAEFFESVFENCIRCNACRQSCPLCYCEKCVIDQESSSYHNGANTVPNASMALLTWSLHLAGRCVDCRNCEKACPKNLPLHLLHKQNEAVIYDNFQNHLAGVEPDDRGALYKYNMDDPDNFIM